MNKQQQQQLQQQQAQSELEIQELKRDIAAMKNHIANLTNSVTFLSSQVAITSHVNTVLKQNLDKLQQYTRRSCLVFHGVPTENNETVHDVESKIKDIINNELNISEQMATSIVNDFDKAHRIGKKEGAKQAIIVKFKSHSKRTLVYYNRPKPSFRNGINHRPNIRIRPSLTPYRADLLEAARSTVDKVEDIEFVFADVFGDLKMRLKQPVNGSYIKGFDTLEDVEHTIHSFDFFFSSDEGDIENHS